MHYLVRTVRGIQVGPRRMVGNICTDPGFRFVEDLYADETLQAAVKNLRTGGEPVELRFRGWHIRLEGDGTWSVQETPQRPHH